MNKPAPSHRATESGAGMEPVANCCCLAILNSTATVWTDEGCCCPIRDSYLLLGLEVCFNLNQNCSLLMARYHFQYIIFLQKKRFSSLLF